MFGLLDNGIIYVFQLRYHDQRGTQTKEDSVCAKFAQPADDGKIVKTFAESEFEKYRIIQDSLYESDFDKLMEESSKELEKKDE